jgi:maleylacetoacetate isomerase
MNDLKLYNYFRSSTSFRVRIALEHKNLSYTYMPVHLINNGGEQNSTEYRKLNPIGGVPTLVHGEKTISQSLAILDYLEESFTSTAKLLPKDNFLKAKVKQVCELINADIHPLQNLKVMCYLEKTISVSPEAKQAWLNKWIGDGLIALENTLLPFAGKHCFGDEFTMADALLVPQMFSANRFNVDTSSFTLLTKINENALALPAVQKAHPLRQPDTPADLLIK